MSVQYHNTTKMLLIKYGDYNEINIKINEYKYDLPEDSDLFHLCYYEDGDMVDNLC